MKKIENLYKFLCKIISLILIVTFNFSVFTACSHFEKGKKEKEDVMESKPQELSNKTYNLTQSFCLINQEAIYVLDEWLYYCDSIRNNAFYAYNLQTEEEKLITNEQGSPYKTLHGFFYIINTKVYEIKNFTLELLCKLPENSEFVDKYQNTIYWTQNQESIIDSIKYNSCQFLYSWTINTEKVITKSSSKTLYISSNNSIINTIILLNDTIYIGQSNGLYILNCKETEKKCIFIKDVMSLYSDGKYVVFKGLEEDNLYWLYEIIPEDNSVQKIEDSTVNTFTSINEGILYFNNSTGIVSYNFKDKSYKNLSENFGLGGQSYTNVAFFKDYLVLRHGYNYNIYLFDMLTNTFRCIISEQ